MVAILLAFLAAARVFLRSRADAAEYLRCASNWPSSNGNGPGHPWALWTGCSGRLLQQTWDRRKDVLVIVQPDTVVRWHRVGFRLYWRWKSRPRGGGPKVSEEIHALIVRFAHQNPDWGAPRIHGELQKLGFAISERTIARYLRRIQRRGDPGKKWLAFLRNHREAIVAFDFFTVPTVTFRVSYCFFVIGQSLRGTLDLEKPPKRRMSYCHRKPPKPTNYARF